MNSAIGFYFKEETIQKLDELVAWLNELEGKERTDTLLVKNLKRSDLMRCAVSIGLDKIEEGMGHMQEAKDQRWETK
jgi:hypothetical protein